MDGKVPLNREIILTQENSKLLVWGLKVLAMMDLRTRMAGAVKDLLEGGDVDFNEKAAEAYMAGQLLQAYSDAVTFPQPASGKFVSKTIDGEAFKEIIRMYRLLPAQWESLPEVFQRDEQKLKLLALMGCVDDLECSVVARDAVRPNMVAGKS